MQPGNRKDILFFSNYCDYSNDIVNMMVKKNVKNEFMLVCVDNSKFQLPQFVDRVPIIYTKHDELIYDDNILKYIEAAFQTESVEDIQPWSIQQPSNYSNQFSFLMDDVPDLQSKGYTMLGYDQKITIPPEESDVSKKDKFDSSQMDKLMQERKADEEKFKKSINNDTENVFRR
jgi:hypothetical protein